MILHSQSRKIEKVDRKWYFLISSGMMLWPARSPAGASKHLKKVYTKPSNVEDAGEGSNGGMLQRSLSTPSSPSTPGTPTNMSPTVKRDNVWRSVFNPGSNLATKSVGSDYFDKPQPNSPTVYDWLYSGDTRSKHR